MSHFDDEGAEMAERDACQVCIYLSQYGDVTHGDANGIHVVSRGYGTARPVDIFDPVELPPRNLRRPAADRALANPTKVETPLPVCERCNFGIALLRRLWSTSVTAMLCSDCNDLVQGPDHCDVHTDNLA